MQPFKGNAMLGEELEGARVNAVVGRAKGAQIIQLTIEIVDRPIIVGTLFGQCAASLGRPPKPLFDVGARMLFLEKTEGVYQRLMFRDDAFLGADRLEMVPKIRGGVELVWRDFAEYLDEELGFRQ